MSSLAGSETTVEIRVLSVPMHVYCSYKLYGSVLPYDRLLRVHTRTRRLTGNEWLTDTNQDNSKNTIHHSRTNAIKIIIHSHLIEYNVIIPSHPSSSSQVSLYGPPLNQLCQDNLPLTSNTPLYQSQVPFSGFHLLNYARMTYTSTIKCLASYPAFCN